MLKKPFLIKQGKTISLTEKPKKNKKLFSEKEQEKLLLALENVSKVLTVEVDLHKILEDMATIVARAIGAKWVNFWRLTPDKEALYITAAYGMKREYMGQSKEHPIALGKAWIGRAVKTQKAWATSDILSDPRLIRELGITWEKAIKKQDYRALLCVPTVSIRGPVGGMCVYYPDVHQFTDFEMRLVTIAANQAATAITNTQIFNELLTEKNKTFATIQSLQDGLITYDLQDRIVFFNPKAEKMLWLAAGDVIGKNIGEKFKRENVYYKNLYNINRLVQIEYVTKEYTTEGPQRLTLAITHIPIRDQEYRKIGSMKILRDVTREKEVEFLKSSFISTASHQLRTPLSAIKWSLNILTEEEIGSLNQKQKDLLKKTINTNESLIGMASDLLDVSRIEEGKFGYNFKLGDLGILMKNLFAELKTDAKRNNIEFKLEEPVIPIPKISFDQSKLEIAIRNVIDNAIKYSRSGGLVRVELQAEKNSVFLTVKDNGIGIPKKDQKFIFVKFFRAQNAIRHQTEGSGLGLYIAKSITDKHNALLNFDSDESKGSTFTFQFPLDPKMMPKGVVEVI